MFPFVKHLRAFVFQAVLAIFGLFWTLMFPNVSQELTWSGKRLHSQGILPRGLLLGQSHLASQLPVHFHGELEVAMPYQGLYELRMRPPPRAGR